jgi:acetyl-CoA carboxylase biotin carboxyl carrier protein
MQMAKAEGDSSGKGKGDVFDVARIREIISLMEECDLNEVDLKQHDQQIRLVRGRVAAPTAQAVVAQTPVPIAAGPAMSAVSSIDEAHIKLIKSPMVGTFYSKANPKSEDFVKVGSKVTPDMVVCIVEAMKVFNDIPAEISGTIVEILATNEEAVDYDRPLFKVDTRG